jgi:hypothetical protein
MTDPRETTERHEHRGIVDSGAGGSDAAERTTAAERTAADDTEAAEARSEREAASRGGEPDDLEADNAVEADSLETLDPDNPPA